jgi:DNA mismatch repair ATPase MutS
MDEYLLEINDLRRRIAKLKFERASVTIIEELEAQLRILKAIYDSATALYAAGEKDRQLQASFGERDLGSWTFDNVYFYVYEQAVAIEPDGHDLATLIWHHDYTAPLVSSVPAK